MGVLGIYAFLAGIMVFVFVIALILYVLTVLGMFKVFEKMNIEGWKAIIPVYNDYVLAGGVWKQVFIIYLVAAVLIRSIIVRPIANNGGFIGILFGLIGLILAIICIVIRARYCYWISKSFGYDIGFAIGLFFVPFVCFLVLGFGEAKYQGNAFENSGLQY